MPNTEKRRQAAPRFQSRFIPAPPIAGLRRKSARPRGCAGFQCFGPVKTADRPANGGVLNVTIRNNDYTQLGANGWVLDPDSSWFSEGGAILLGYPQSLSGDILEGNHVVESVSPTGTRFPLGSTLCDQVFDALDTGSISGYKACGNPNWEDISSHLEAIHLDDGLLAGRSAIRP